MSSATDTSNAAPLGSDPSQQSLLTIRSTHEGGALASLCSTSPLPPSPPAEKATARPDLMSATRWARTADFYDAMDRDIVYPNLGIY